MCADERLSCGCLFFVLFMGVEYCVTAYFQSFVCGLKLTCLDSMHAKNSYLCSIIDLIKESVGVKWICLFVSVEGEHYTHGFRGPL